MAGGNQAKRIQTESKPGFSSRRPFAHIRGAAWKSLLDTQMVGIPIVPASRA